MYTYIAISNIYTQAFLIQIWMDKNPLDLDEEKPLMGNIHSETDIEKFKYTLF